MHTKNKQDIVSQLYFNKNISKHVEGFNILNRLNPISIYKLLNFKIAEYALVLCAHRTVTKIDHLWNHKKKKRSQ